MSAETGIDGRVSVRIGIVNTQVATGASQGKDLGRRVIGSGLAERRHVAGIPGAGGDPDPALAVHHGVMDRGGGVPDRFFTPIGRRRHRGCRLRVVIRVLRKYRYLVGSVIDRVQYRQVVGTVFQGAVNFTVGVDRGVPTVRRNQVMQVGGGIGPVPLSDHHVTLQPLGPLRSRGQLTGRDAIGPVGVHFQGPAVPHTSQDTGHEAAGLARANPPVPGVIAGFGVGKQCRDGARGGVAHLVADHAATIGDPTDVIVLGQYAGSDAIAIRPGAGELVGFGYLQQ